MVATDLTELVQDGPAHRWAGMAVSVVDGFEVLPFGISAHNVTLLKDDQMGYILYCVTIALIVTF